MRSGLAFVVAVLRALRSERRYVPTFAPLEFDAAKRAQWHEMVENGRRVA